MFSSCSQTLFACERSPIYKRRHKTLAQTIVLIKGAPFHEGNESDEAS
jgi:hypothetical protein